MCFDILYLNGVNLLNLSTYQRFEILRKLFLDIPKNSHLKLLQTIETQNLDQFSEFYFECIEKGLEGIIAKAKESTYEPGTRNFQWIKLKYNVIAEKVDTIDLLVMGYYAGGGQRAKFGFGALLCGVVGSDEKIYSTAKVGSGFSEELLKEVFPILQELQVKNADPSYVFNKAIKPDSWVRPKMIIEVDADEITRSPLYSAGLGISANLKKDDVTKGLSLRFPRIKRIRFDKTSPNSVDELVRIYELRKRTLS
jgi:DNA ligase-1